METEALYDSDAEHRNFGKLSRLVDVKKQNVSLLMQLLGDWSSIFAKHRGDVWMGLPVVYVVSEHFIRMCRIHRR